MLQTNEYPALFKQLAWWDDFCCSFKKKKKFQNPEWFRHVLKKNTKPTAVQWTNLTV